jgi:DnaJ-class molecular chaperone
MASIITRITTVIIEEFSNYFIVKCGHCRGTGQLYPGYSGSSSYRQYKCPTCEGLGVRKISIPDDWDKSITGLLICAHCRGTGQLYPGYDDTSSYRQYQCPTCQGIGVLVKYFPRISCPHCKGTGQLYPDYDSTSSYRQTPCPTCEGSGSNWIEKVK